MDLSNYLTPSALLDRAKCKGENPKIIYHDKERNIFVLTTKGLVEPDGNNLAGRTAWVSSKIKNKWYEMTIIVISTDMPRKAMIGSFFHEMIHAVCYMFKGSYAFENNKDKEEMFAGIFGVETAKIFSKIEKKLK